MASYGRAYGFKFALYCAVNKNNDELYFEIVELDFLQADDLFRKAEGIIFRQTQPAKIAQTATFFDCKYCDFQGVCHREKPRLRIAVVVLMLFRLMMHNGGVNYTRQRLTPIFLKTLLPRVALVGRLLSMVETKSVTIGQKFDRLTVVSINEKLNFKLVVAFVFAA